MIWPGMFDTSPISVKWLCRLTILLPLTTDSPLSRWLRPLTSVVSVAYQAWIGRLILASASLWASEV